MLRFIATLTLAFVTAIALALIARPTLRAAIIAEWNDPAKLPWDFPDLLRMMAGRAVFISAPLGDDNFDNSGVRDCVRAVSGLFRKGKLETAYPDCGHDFPPEVRQQAYAFLDRA